MALNTNLIKNLLKEKLAQNPALLGELNLKNAQELSNLSDQQLESLLSPKILGLLSLNRKDLEL